jgi:hypothetical protein
LRVVDEGLDLAPMADDAFILEQAIEIAPGEARDPVEIEIVEGGAEVFALGQDGAPAQSRLKALQTELLEQAAIIADRKTPFGVVISEELWRGAAPAASRLAGPRIVVLMCTPPREDGITSFSRGRTSSGRRFSMA